MNKKRYIAQQSGQTQVKIFDAETGSLYRVVDVGGEINSPPICTESDMYVGVTGPGNSNSIKYFAVPTFSLRKVVST